MNLPLDIHSTFCAQSGASSLETDGPPHPAANIDAVIAAAGPSTQTSLALNSSARHAQRKASPVAISTAGPPEQHHSGATKSSTGVPQPTLRRQPSGSVPLLRMQYHRDESHPVPASTGSRPASSTSTSSLGCRADDMDSLASDLGRKCKLNKSKRKRVSFNDDIAVIGGPRRVKTRRISEPYSLRARPTRTSPEDA